MVIARIFPRPFGVPKNTTQLAKYPHVLYAKPSNKVYISLTCLSFRRTCQLARMGSFQMCLEAAVRHTCRGQKNFSALLRIIAPLLRKIEIAHHKPHLGNITEEQLQEVILSFYSLKVTYDFSTFKALEISN